MGHCRTYRRCRCSREVCVIKDIPEGNKGLKKLPTEVRNKMGYKKRGGSLKKMKHGGKCKVDGIATRGRTKIRGK